MNLCKTTSNISVKHIFLVGILLIVKMLKERTTKRVGLTDRIWKFYSQWKTNRKPM